MATVLTLVFWCGLVFSTLPLGALIPLTLLLVVHLVYVIRRYAWLKQDNACIHLEISSRHQLHITYQNGQCDQDVYVRYDSVVSPYLILLSYVPKNAPRWRRVFGYYLIIMRDSTDAESFRKLSVWLRWGHHPKTD